ncbi:MAG: hypothetical protein AAFZ35_23640 [Cyanobacteria bacterium J06649_12]
MTIELIGVEDVFLDSPTQVFWPSVQARDNRGFTFLIEALPETVPLSTHYLLMLANIQRGAFNAEIPLRAKYYPKGFGMLFGVTIPNIQPNGNYVIQVSAIPKPRFRGVKGPATPVQFRLSWEENQTEPTSYTLN